MKFQSTDAEQPEINLTALIDVVFLLLIFFMVSTTFDRQQVLPITLPAASEGERQSQAQVFEITLTQGGAVDTEQWSGRVDDPKLTAVLREWHTSQPDGAVIIYADTAVSHGDVVGLMDQVAQADIQSVQLATRYNQD
ncbi:MAG: biopolymer transporter ExbD [Wenzhouxiangella sp.]|jgi:biopolymer transport protein ExbD|nr:biopolymer transporter ExbD [Wenzhouxiangella sp.]MDR9452818.1 biopolymer transporter ExbD [Wenzhouxiangella sp.]